MHPYIGITDFTNFDQVQKMLSVFTAHLPAGSTRKLHVGVMMSYKTLHGIPSKWSNVFPPEEKIADIFASNDTYNCLHYADYDNHPDFWKDISNVISRLWPGIRAVQLDMIWPEPGGIANMIHASRHNLEAILQIGKNALEEANNDPAEVVDRLRDYEDVIHRVLLDKSMRKGLGMDAHSLLPFARAIRNRFPKLGIGAAGGLGPETIQIVEPLAKEFPDISIDAQGRLRPSGNALDPIDWNMAGTYLVKALQLLG